MLDKMADILKVKYEFHELDSIPSVDLRYLIDRANEKKLSFQWKDALLNSDLVNPDIKHTWTKNPWEQGQTFKKWKQIESNRPLLTTSSGCIVDLYAPSRYKLYVNYCKEVSDK
jgi:hypothetical protein